jgi:hypothetical protein
MGRLTVAPQLAYKASSRVGRGLFLAYVQASDQKVEDIALQGGETAEKQTRGLLPICTDRAEKGKRMAACTTRWPRAIWWNEERHGPHPLHRRRCLLHILKPISVVEFYV